MVTAVVLHTGEAGCEALMVTAVVLHTGETGREAKLRSPPGLRLLRVSLSLQLSPAISSRPVAYLWVQWLTSGLPVAYQWLTQWLTSFFICFFIKMLSRLLKE